MCGRPGRADALRTLAADPELRSTSGGKSLCDAAPDSERYKTGACEWTTTRQKAGTIGTSSGDWGGGHLTERQEGPAGAR
jgi:hypothetical protein